jgi:threonine/homoserine/homoserine lactone efflux protein
MDFTSLGIQDFWLFLTAGVMLNLTPGQDTMYIVGRSIAEGRSAGITSALGVSTGALVHVTAATLGLSAILATSAVAFTIVKFAGVAYLVYLGVRLLVERDSENSFETGRSGAQGKWTAYRRGILTNLLNPKVAVFFLAFLPQFVDPAAGHKTLSMFVLGCTFLVTGTVWCLVVAVLSARVSDAFRRSKTASRIVRRATGGLFIGLGVRIALERSE